MEFNEVTCNYHRAGQFVGPIYGPIPVTLGDVLVPAQLSRDRREGMTEVTQKDIDDAVKQREALIAEWFRKMGRPQIAMMIENQEHLK